MNRRTAIVVAGALGFFLGGGLFGEDQIRSSSPDTSAGAPRTPQGLTNDNCADAIPIFGGDTDYDTTGASTDGVVHEECQFNGATGHDVWYNYAATCTGDLTVSTCGQATYDTDLVVYDGCQPDDWACPPGDAEMLGCNDSFRGCPFFTSYLIVPVVEGNCYTVRVGGWMNGDWGSGTVTLACLGVCGDGNCDDGENECNCPTDCPGVCPCTIFTIQSEFEAFIEDEGKFLKGVEDFEEGTLPPADVNAFDDPLCGGIPNSPDAFPYPNGLDQLNMCVQSNTLAGAPTVPAPAGLNGLAAASAGFLGAVSDVVVSNQLVNSYDIMLINPPVTPGEEDDHTGVGFNTLAFVGGNTVEIRVYNKDNALLFSDTSPANPAGSSFWGAWCVDLIGRINIFDPDDGAEGADNIQMWAFFDTCGENGCESEEGETSCVCPEDCGPESCGNGDCCSADGEDCDTCPADCGACSTCGDGMVNQVGEECDGSDDSACPHVCGSDCTCQPAENDFCADAIGIKCGDTDYNTTGATTDGPLHPECQFDGQTYHDIWFKHTAALSGDLTVSTCDQADYGTDLVVYDGCDCGDLVLLGCNDDFPGCAGFSSEVTVPVVAGNCYFVRLGGWLDGDMGTATVTLSGEACGGPDCGSCPTDVDGSGDTGAADLAVLLGSWGPCAPSEACACLDANDDGTIGAEDLAVLLGAWGRCL